MTMDDEADVWEERPTFQGECTCEHDRDEHTWGACDVDGCPCEAGWEE